ncbi:MAG: VCBS repeat-containing protein [Tunicatimonas sp.]
MRLLFLVVWPGLVALLVRCGTDSPAVVEPPDGRQLSVQHCGTCHAYPEPGLLDRATWQNYVLPRMGHRLGIYANDSVRASLIETGTGGQFVEQANIYPTQPQLTETAWKALQAYYSDHAPPQLDSIQAPLLTVGLPTFRTRVPEFRLSPPSTTLVRIQPGGFFIGDANSRRLYQFDAQRQLLNAANVREGAVSVAVQPSALNVTVMGSFSPTDAPTGFVLALPTQADESPRVLLDSLQRPVHTAYADLNGDGQEDIITAEFGKWTGGLAWWENRGDDRYRKHWLRQQPGATRVYVRDLNGDQQPDVLALFGQGDEGVFAYYNQGDGTFREEALLRFPPSYGSSSLMLYDTDGDGYEDLVYTAGDNADYPPVTKPYHGIRVFRNDGTNHFREAWFYPLPGAYGAIPADFDQDGDLDIAAISFFPDYAQSAQRGFVYLENQGDFRFKEYTFPEVTDGRWLVMDAGDVDQDGDVDIVLGSLSFEVVPPNGLLAQWVERGVPFVVLENTQR